MNKLLFSLVLTILLSGCIDLAQFDAIDEATIIESTKRTIKGLSEEQQRNLVKPLSTSPLGVSLVLCQCLVQSCCQKTI